MARAENRVFIFSRNQLSRDFNSGFVFADVQQAAALPAFPLYPPLCVQLTDLLQGFFRQC